MVFPWDSLQENPRVEKAVSSPHDRQTRGLRSEEMSQRHTTNVLFQRRPTQSTTSSLKSQTHM